MLYIGNDESRFYIEMGRGIEAVNKAENMCESGGDIVVSPYAWIHCQSLNGDYKVMADKKHVKVCLSVLVTIFMCHDYVAVFSCLKLYSLYSARNTLC